MDARSRVIFVVSALAPLAALAASTPARADETTSSRSTATSDDRPADPPAIDDAHPGRPRDHVEFTMGFLGGQRAYDSLAFALDSASAANQIPGAAKLTQPFTQAPYKSVDMLGLRYELRVHIAYARMTAGFDLPFSVYNQVGTAASYDVGGQMRSVAVQSLSAKEAHFGLGAEVPFGRFVPFVDLIGGVHWVSTDLTIDGLQGSYSSTAFAMSLRGGARAYMRRWFFVQAAGEVGLLGDLRWNAELSVGAALPW
jgi:hypothetical protein